jgi:tRNA G18 (ribose-2'-O)-methylase SpoU
MNAPVNLDEIQRETYREDIAGLNVHNHLKDKSVPELRDISMSDRFPFAVMALSLTGDGNVGGIVRSAVLHGAEKVWIYGRRKFDKRPTVGSLNYIDHEIIDGFEDNKPGIFDVQKFMTIIAENEYFPVFVEQGGTSLEEFDWNALPDMKILLVLGNETNGIPEEFMKVMEDLSEIVSIPQRGVIRSFNVSNAMNIVTWDMRMKKKWF